MFRTIFFSRIASAIATWLAIFTALFGLLVWATPDWFGSLRWSQIALLGFAFALATVLVVGCAVASFAYALRKIRPLPAGADGHALYEELQRTQERLRRAEERLDGARIVSAVGRASASDKPSNQTVSLPLLDNTVSGMRRLTDADRERCSLTLQEVHDFIGSELMPFLSELQRANAKSPHEFILALVILQESRRQLDERSRLLWHRHSHYLDLMKLDIEPILQSLQAMRNPIAKALAALDWPEEAKAERTRAVAECIKNLNKSIVGVSKSLPEKRAEYIDA